MDETKAIEFFSEIGYKVEKGMKSWIKLNEVTVGTDTIGVGFPLTDFSKTGFYSDIWISGVIVASLNQKGKSFEIRYNGKEGEKTLRDFLARAGKTGALKILDNEPKKETGQTGTKERRLLMH